jgi:hypothetical protein
MKIDSVFNDLDAIKDKDSDEWWLAAERLEATANTALGEILWLDIYNGKLLVRKANGDPLDGEPKNFSIRGINAPHLTRDEGNKWLSENITPKVDDTISHEQFMEDVFKLVDFWEDTEKEDFKQNVTAEVGRIVDDENELIEISKQYPHLANHNYMSVLRVQQFLKKNK